MRWCCLQVLLVVAVLVPAGAGSNESEMGGGSGRGSKHIRIVSGDSCMNFLRCSRSCRGFSSPCNTTSFNLQP